ncbi:MAG TPA: LysM peptidoglycan-binding domain-containing protein [Candidatus Aquilonibacter sp.]|nr:LysM peptidoglycan-binding domain-containing protein [Candidatus Aquilonibacter sp.]
MNNPNPFVPQGSILEQQSKRRSRLKLAVFCVLAVSVAGLSAMLIQGCKREQAETPDNGTASSDMGSGTSMVDTSSVSPEETSSVPEMPTSSVPAAVTPPITPMVTPPVAPPVETAGTYVVIKGDTLGKIARKNSVTLKALEDANPGVVPTHLKIGQKLTIPAASTIAPTGGATDMSGTTGGGEIYTVKSGDTLSKIAKSQGVTLKMLEAANPNVDPNHIKVGEKLNIPAAAAAAPTPAPTAPAAPPAPVDTTSAPGTPPGN